MATEVTTITALGKKKRKVSAPEKGALLWPGEAGWEIWEVKKKVFSLGQGSLEHFPKGRFRTLGLPLEWLIAVPLRVPAVDQASMVGMVSMQFEKLGVVAPGAAELIKPALFEGGEDGGKKRVLAMVPGPGLPEGLDLEGVSRFEPAFLRRSLPARAVVLWKELGTWCCAVTGDCGPVAAQSLGVSRLEASTMVELRCAILQVAAEMSFEPQSLVVQGSLDPAERALMAEWIDLPLQVQSAGAPGAEDCPLQVVPEEVQRRRAQRQRRVSIQRGMAVAAGLYAVLLLGIVVWFVSERRSLQRLDDEVQRIRPVVSRVQRDLQLWNGIEPLLDRRRFALEELTQIASLLKNDQVRLTFFRSGPKVVEIRGESQTAPEAVAFLGRLRAHPYFSGIRWRMNEPKILPDYSVSFTVEGER